MKPLNLPNLFFYFFILFFLSTKIVELSASQNSLFRSKKNIIKQTLLGAHNSYFLIETLRMIKQVEQNFGIRINELEFQSNENNENNENNEKDQDFIHDILIVLIGTYQKIISATVTYCLMYNFSDDQNLHQSIAVILTEDAVTIVKIIGSQCVKFFMNPTTKWKKKLYYSLGLVVAIMLIKYGIDAIPQKEKTDKESLLDDKINKKDEAKTLYLSGEFDNYK